MYAYIFALCTVLWTGTISLNAIWFKFYQVNQVQQFYTFENWPSLKGISYDKIEFNDEYHKILFHKKYQN